jgi:hypothetical protein
MPSVDAIPLTSFVKDQIGPRFKELRPLKEETTSRCRCTRAGLDGAGPTLVGSLATPGRSSSGEATFPLAPSYRCADGQGDGHAHRQPRHQAHGDPGITFDDGHADHRAARPVAPSRSLVPMSAPVDALGLFSSDPGGSAIRPWYYDLPLRRPPERTQWRRTRPRWCCRRQQ